MSRRRIPWAQWPSQWLGRLQYPLTEPAEAVPRPLAPGISSQESREVLNPEEGIETTVFRFQDYVVGRLLSSPPSLPTNERRRDDGDRNRRNGAVSGCSGTSLQAKGRPYPRDADSPEVMKSASHYSRMRQSLPRSHDGRGDPDSPVKPPALVLNSSRPSAACRDPNHAHLRAPDGSPLGEPWCGLDRHPITVPRKRM